MQINVPVDVNKVRIRVSIKRARNNRKGGESRVQAWGTKKKNYYSTCRDTFSLPVHGMSGRSSNVRTPRVLRVGGGKAKGGSQKWRRGRSNSGI